MIKKKQVKKSKIITMDKIDIKEVQKQLEYYFSDKNLSQDEFFHKEIEKNEEVLLFQKQI